MSQESFNHSVINQLIMEIIFIFECKNLRYDEKWDKRP